jgi:hypothetical protein
LKNLTVIREMMEAAGTLKTSANFHRTTGSNNTENSLLQKNNLLQEFLAKTFDSGFHKIFYLCTRATVICFKMLVIYLP